MPPYSVVQFVQCRSVFPLQCCSVRYSASQYSDRCSVVYSVISTVQLPYSADTVLFSVCTVYVSQGRGFWECQLYFRPVVYLLTNSYLLHGGYPDLAWFSVAPSIHHHPDHIDPSGRVRVFYCNATSYCITWTKRRNSKIWTSVPLSYQSMSTRVEFINHKHIYNAPSNLIYDSTHMHVTSILCLNYHLTLNINIYSKCTMITKISSNLSY